jgi:betaine-homocysteine S-methyltransferase
MAEALGRKPPASRYSPDMSKHYALGNDARLRQDQRAYATDL